MPWSQLKVCKQRSKSQIPKDTQPAGQLSSKVKFWKVSRRLEKEKTWPTKNFNIDLGPVFLCIACCENEGWYAESSCAAFCGNCCSCKWFLRRHTIHSCTSSSSSSSSSPTTALPSSPLQPLQLDFYADFQFTELQKLKTHWNNISFGKKSKTVKCHLFKIFCFNVCRLHNSSLSGCQCWPRYGTLH